MDARPPLLVLAPRNREVRNTLRAVYRNGAFVPGVSCDLPEETEVEVRVRDATEDHPPLESNPAKRAEIKKRL